MRLIILATALVLVICSGHAWARPLEGLTVQEIKSLPNFVPLTTPLVYKVRESAEPGAAVANEWIGYVELEGELDLYGSQFVLVDKQGYLSTRLFGMNEAGNATPVWAADAIDYLYERGFFTAIYD